MLKFLRLKHLPPFILIIIAYLLNSLYVPLFLGVDFLFGSIITILTLRLYGFTYGVITGATASLFTIVLWGHPYAAIILTLEVVFLGMFLQKRKSNIVIIDAIFWLIIGMGLSYLLYHFALNMDVIASLLVVMKLSLNGIFNALIASLIIEFTPITSWVNNNKHMITLKSILFHSVVALFVIPVVVLLAFQGQREFQKIENEIIQELDTSTANINNSLDTFFEYHTKPIQTLSDQESVQGVEPSQELQEDLEQLVRSVPDFYNAYVGDATGNVVGFYPPINYEGESTLQYNFSDREYFKEVKDSKELVISDVLRGRGGITSPILTISSPIMNGTEFKGYVTGALNLNYVTNLILNERQNEQIQVTLIDQKKRTITSTESENKVLKFFQQPADTSQKGVNENVTLLKPDDENMPAMVRWENSVYRSVHDNQEFPWSIIVDIPVEHYQTQLYLTYLKILSITTIMSYIIILLCFMLSERLTAPIYNLGKMTTDMKNHILTQNEVEISFPQTRIREVFVLVQNFKTMSKELSTSFQDLFLTQRKLNYMAYHDQLTGLANREFLMEKLQEDLDQEGSFGALFFLDLDRFKFINDTFGHHKGDDLLVEVSERLRKVCPENALISRQGGDEFIILLPEQNDKEAGDVAKQIIQDISKPYIIQGQELHLTTSIGISLYPYTGASMNDLIQFADLSMYKAKELGRNRFVFYSNNYLEQNQKRVLLEKELNYALEREEFFLLYQPKSDLSEKRITGVEALIRWKHHSYGIVSPGDFIPIAEETELIIPIGDWVIQEACKQIKVREREGVSPLQFSVNISMKQLLHDNLVDKIQYYIHKFNIEPSLLEIEVTESMALEQANVIIDRLNQIHNLGVRIALDDFGTGYSSLSYLKDLPIDVLKIDRSFVNELHENYGVSVVNSIIDVAHSLDMVVVAEGIEEEAQLQLLLEGNCDKVQGYLVSKPILISELYNDERLLNEKIDNLITNNKNFTE